MIFKLTTSGHYYNEPEMRELEKLGFTFKRAPSDAYRPWVRDVGVATVSFSTLEELMLFQQQVGAIILDGDEIEIYDDYRE